MTDPGDSSRRYEAAAKALAYRGRSARRDRAETRLLDRLLEGIDLGPTLDAPCGTGRLTPLLRRRHASYVGLDLAASMLAEADRDGCHLVRARVDRLPFADRAFDSVVCFRFLHHLRRPRQQALVAELARVAGRHLVLSAFHPVSTHRLARSLRSRLGGSPAARHPTAASTLDGWLRDAGFAPRARRRQGPLRDLWAGIWTR